MGARAGPGIRRFVYVSSGSVYRHHGPDWSGEPLPEDGYVAPLTLYGISKFAAEMVANRYADLFGLPAVSVRLSSVYGPMDRVTGSRNVRHVPNRIAHMALSGETIRPTSLDPTGDYVLSTDVASAILGLIDAPELRYRHYNIGSGATTIGGQFHRLGARAYRRAFGRGEPPPKPPTSSSTRHTRPACGANTTLAASCAIRAGGRATRARPSTPTWTGSPPTRPCEETPDAKRRDASRSRSRATSSATAPTRLS